MSGEGTEDRPRSMRCASVREARRAMLTEHHIALLSRFVAKLRGDGSEQVPEFDPLDGGIDAEILFLFEKPGPMTSGSYGSGFISRNNDDPTAEATFKFMQEAGIPRKLTLTWNLIPWWNGTRKVTAQELKKGLACLEDLIRLLPRLRVVVLVGRSATRALQFLRARHPHLRVLLSAHPSPLVRASNRKLWESIPSEWAKVLNDRSHFDS